MGAPGKIVREVSDDDLKRIRQGVRSYIERMHLYRDRLKAV
jgi:carbonic anhydrase/acetyltransferase-like protein (isoleucine patch superfamily)